MSKSPPFKITSKILNYVSKIQELAGQMKMFTVNKPAMKLKKENKIKTVHSSLAIEGNVLSESQISDIIDNKRVIGPKFQILEVQNALKVYDSLSSYNSIKEKDLLAAHKELTKGLIKQAGKYRTIQVGVFKGSVVSHMAPSAKLVPELMKGLFDFLKNDKETPWLIKACVFHYELEFIHPFEDGNGRMGRLWQQSLLMKQSPIFEYISTESLVHAKQKEYYRVLEACDKAGDSTVFIEFSLEIILECLTDFHKKFIPKRSTNNDRINLAIEYFGTKSFSRKEYMNLNKGISTATASRDLASAVKGKKIKMIGDKVLAVYKTERR